jgi:hypothetical protein
MPNNEVYKSHAIPNSSEVVFKALV